MTHVQTHTSYIYLNTYGNPHSIFTDIETYWSFVELICIRFSSFVTIDWAVEVVGLNYISNAFDHLWPGSQAYCLLGHQILFCWRGALKGCGWCQFNIFCCSDIGELLSSDHGKAQALRQDNLQSTQWAPSQSAQHKRRSSLKNRFKRKEGRERENYTSKKIK